MEEIERAFEIKFISPDSYLPQGEIDVFTFMPVVMKVEDRKNWPKGTGTKLSNFAFPYEVELEASTYP